MMTSPWKASRLREVAKLPVTCEGEKDCEVKWARAMKWAKRKGKTGIATQTTSLIKTNPSANLSTDAAFTIAKVETSPGNYRFDFAVDCDDDFGCVPPRLELKDSFVEYVMGMSAKIK